MTDKDYTQFKKELFIELIVSQNTGNLTKNCFKLLEWLAYYYLNQIKFKEDNLKQDYYSHIFSDFLNYWRNCDLEKYELASIHFFTYYIKRNLPLTEEQYEAYRKRYFD